MTRFRDLFADEDAVSPVIGVILMVAITVILAAVIGTFVLGLGNQVSGSQAPQADFEWDYNDTSNNLTVTHNGGDAVNNDSVEFAGDDGGVTYASGNFSLGGDSKWQAGDSADLGGGDNGETIRMVWTAEGGGSSQTISEYDVPQ